MERCEIEEFIDSLKEPAQQVKICYKEIFFKGYFLTAEKGNTPDEENIWIFRVAGKADLIVQGEFLSALSI